MQTNSKQGENLLEEINYNEELGLNLDKKGGVLLNDECITKFSKLLQGTMQGKGNILDEKIKDKKLPIELFEGLETILHGRKKITPMQYKLLCKHFNNEDLIEAAEAIQRKRIYFMREGGMTDIKPPSIGNFKEIIKQRLKEIENNDEYPALYLAMVDINNNQVVYSILGLEDEIKTGKFEFGYHINCTGFSDSFYTGPNGESYLGIDINCSSISLLTKGSANQKGNSYTITLLIKDYIVGGEIGENSESRSLIPLNLSGEYDAVFGMSLLGEEKTQKGTDLDAIIPYTKLESGVKISQLKNGVTPIDSNWYQWTEQGPEKYATIGEDKYELSDYVEKKEVAGETYDVVRIKDDNAISDLVFLDEKGKTLTINGYRVVAVGKKECEFESVSLYNEPLNRIDEYIINKQGELIELEKGEYMCGFPNLLKMSQKNIHACYVIPARAYAGEVNYKLYDRNFKALKYKGEYLYDDSYPTHSSTISLIMKNGFRYVEAQRKQDEEGDDRAAYFFHGPEGTQALGLGDRWELVANELTIHHLTENQTLINGTQIRKGYFRDLEGGPDQFLYWYLADRGEIREHLGSEKDFTVVGVEHKKESILRRKTKQVTQRIVGKSEDGSVKSKFLVRDGNRHTYQSLPGALSDFPNITLGKIKDSLVGKIQEVRSNDSEITLPSNRYLQGGLPATITIDSYGECGIISMDNPKIEEGMLRQRFTLRKDKELLASVWLERKKEKETISDAINLVVDPDDKDHYLTNIKPHSNCGGIQYLEKQYSSLEKKGNSYSRMYIKDATGKSVVWKESIGDTIGEIIKVDESPRFTEEGVRILQVKMKFEDGTISNAGFVRDVIGVYGSGEPKLSDIYKVELLESSNK